MVFRIKREDLRKESRKEGSKPGRKEGRKVERKEEIILYKMRFTCFKLNEFNQLHAMSQNIMLEVEIKTDINNTEDRK